MSGDTKVLAGFAAVIWLIATAASIDMALGNPTAINAVLGLSLPGLVVTAWAWVSHREDLRDAAEAAARGRLRP